MNILITGFEPFGKHDLNPSQRLVKEISPKSSDHLTLQRLILPVDHVAAPQILLEYIGQHQPDCVVSFGLAAGRAKISLERIAVNLKDFRHPDNRGGMVSNETVVNNGPAAYFTTLPLLEIFDALQRASIPVELSLSAGSFLCNQIFYELMHEISLNQRPMRAGFVHLPALPEESAYSEKPMPSLSFSQMIRAGEIIIQVIQQKHNSS